MAVCGVEPVGSAGCCHEYSGGVVGWRIPALWMDYFRAGMADSHAQVTSDGWLNMLAICAETQ